MSFERARAAAEYARAVVNDEEIHFVGKFSKVLPPLDCLVVTDTSVLGLELRSGHVGVHVSLADVVAVESNSTWGKLTLHVTSGAPVLLKSIPPKDLPRLEFNVRKCTARLNDATARSGGGSTAPSADRFGPEVASGSFAGRAIKIYANGYVRVAAGWFTSKTPFEKLLSIDATADVSKKSGLGRGATAAFTMGANLLSSNKRGDVYLTIVTERQTHVLHADPPTEANLAITKKLAAAGQAALGRASTSADQHEQTSTSAERPQPAVSIGERLRVLDELREVGQVGADEYESLRANILRSL